MSEQPGPLAHTRMGHVLALDGLRGLAIAAVLGVHLYAPVFSGGQDGVDLFFVLSGFLITKLAYEEYQSRTTFSRPDFYLRRVFRILPPLFVLLAFLLVASVTFLDDVGHPLRFEILLTAVSAGNFWPFFRGFETRTALAHTWSLGLEEQFYLAWPALLALVPSAFRRPKRFAVWVAIGAVSSVVVGRFIVFGIMDYPHWESVPFFNFDGMAIGGIVAIAVHTDDTGRLTRLPTWPGVVAIAVAVLDFFGARGYQLHDTYRLRPVLLRLCFGYILMLVVTRSDWRPVAVLQHPLLRWVGRLSYSLYLWHLPIFFIFDKSRMPGLPRIVSVPLKVVLSVLAAWLSHNYVEQPALKFGRTVRSRYKARSDSAQTAESSAA